MSSSSHREDLDIALEMADAADAITSSFFKDQNLMIETKPDMTPVSEADRSVERALRGLLFARRPADSITGEEYGTEGEGVRQWFIDPIDGTKNYVRGIPVFATLISLVIDHSPVVGVVSAPALSRRWHAVSGGGAYLNGRRIGVSSVSNLTDAQLSIGDVRSFDNVGLSGEYDRLESQVWRVRGFGDFWSHMLVAEGAVDIAVEAIVAPWDLAALQVIVQEAGGRFTDFQGRSRFDGGNAVSSNGVLHDEVLRLFNPDQLN